MTVVLNRTVLAAARALTTCAAVAVVATACSSSTAGSGSSGSGGNSGGGTSSGAASAPATGSGGGGGSTGNFCTDWSHLGTNMSKIISPGDVRQQIVTQFDRLVAEAPPELKSAVMDVDQYVHGAVNGNPDPSAAQKLAGDFEKIGTWIATNCH